MVDLADATNETGPPAGNQAGAVAEALAEALRAQQQWRQTSVQQRLGVVQQISDNLVRIPRAWADEITIAGRRTLADSLAAEVLPLADACRFLQRNAPKLLRDSRPARRDRPLWGRGLRVRIRREPRGVVLIIGAWNYPLFLAGVQTLQAIVAGNAVLIKPSPRCSAPMRRLAQVLQEGGTPSGLVQVLDESPAAAQQAISQGVEHVVLTGSAATGRKVLAAAAEQITPCTMELSGCDAVFVLPGADIQRVARCVAFGLRLNGSATCIGPRRLFVSKDQQSVLERAVQQQLRAIPPTQLPSAIVDQTQKLVEQALAAGATAVDQRVPEFDPQQLAPILLRAPSVDLPLLRADLFAPVITIIGVSNPDEALQLSRKCPYALGASVFGPRIEAEQFADRVEAGSVTVNDLVAPTADPRAPFGGWNQSGFGVTRGAEGLLEMTRSKTIVTQSSRWLPHLDPPHAGLDRLVIGLLRLAHGSNWKQRLSGLRDVISAARKR